MTAFPADRRLRWIAGSVLAAIAVLILLLGAFPWGWLKPRIEARLSDRVGRPVTIASIERRGVFSFTPTVDIRGLHVPQADWAGSGDLARVDSASVRFSVFPLLIGRFAPKSVEIDGGTLSLARAADGRTNWAGEKKSGSSGGLDLDGLSVRNLRVGYRDAKLDRAFHVQLASDGSGFRVAGTGSVMGGPVRVSARGPSIAAGAGKPWPFTARIDGAALTMAATGTMDRPLDLRHFDVALTARADDLKRIDTVIEAGLFGTQPVALKAKARHDGENWDIKALSGTIGNTDIAGVLTVKKHDGRVRLDGSVRSNRLDFDDLASNEGVAAAAALERAQGLKLVPNTRVNIRKMGETDGRIAFDVRRVVSAKRPSSIASLKGVVSIERSLVTVSPFRLGLKRGAITGRATIDQRGGRGVPVVTLDLRMTGASIAALAGGGENEVDAPLSGRVSLSGPGSTIREAVGRSTGRIGIVARDGILPARVASAIGFDAGRALTTDADKVARLRCLVTDIEIRGGLGRFDTLVIDTSRSGTRGTGTLRFPAEQIAVTLTGAPKQDSLLRLPGSVTVGGTLRAPEITIPPETKSAGNILKAIGRTISGKQGALATDADCAGLAARALR